MITYEYPLNERIRTLLRLEDLYERVRFFLDRDSPHDHHACLTGIFEILEINSEVRKLIAADAGPDALAKAAKLRTMAQHCREKVKEGSVEPEEFLNVIRT